MNESLEKKKALCEKAEALKDSTDWKATADTLTKLQKEWKTIGPVAKKHSDAVWKRFITACDYFFEQKKQGYFFTTLYRSRKHGEEKGIDRKVVVHRRKNMDIEEASTLVRDLMKEWNFYRSCTIQRKR